MMTRCCFGCQHPLQILNTKISIEDIHDLKVQNELIEKVAKLENPAIDELIEILINAEDRKNLIVATKALDRVLLWNYYVIPQWHISAYRVLYWDIFDKPSIRPKYSLGSNTWWINDDSANTIDERKKTLE